MRLQITVDDAFGKELQERAHEMGLSVSSYIRAMLKKSAAKPGQLDLAMDDLKNGRVEAVSLEDLKQQITG